MLYTQRTFSVCISRRRHRALEVTRRHRQALAIDEVTPRHHRRRKALALEGLVTLRRRRKALLLHRHRDSQYQGRQEKCL